MIDGNGRIFAAHQEKADEAVHPRHVQVQQDQVDGAALRCDGFHRLIEAARLQDQRTRKSLRHGLAQGSPHQGMVVGNEDGAGRHFGSFAFRSR